MIVLSGTKDQYLGLNGKWADISDSTPYDYNKTPIHCKECNYTWFNHTKRDRRYTCKRCKTMVCLDDVEYKEG